MTLWQLRNAIKEASRQSPSRELHQKQIVECHLRLEALVEEERRKSRKTKMKKNRLYETPTPSVHALLDQDEPPIAQRVAPTAKRLFDDLEPTEFE